MKFIRIFLLVLIIIGIALLTTQKIWVPKLVDLIIKNEETNTIIPKVPTPIVQIKEEAGTILGTVTTSPTCPVERIPPDSGCAPRPYATSINIREEEKQAIVKTVQSNNLGIFKTDLPVGFYELDAITANGSILPRCNKITVQVKSNQTTTADISCDTGIR